MQRMATLPGTVKKEFRPLTDKGETMMEKKHIDKKKNMTENLI